MPARTPKTIIADIRAELDRMAASAPGDAKPDTGSQKPKVRPREILHALRFEIRDALAAGARLADVISVVNRHLPRALRIHPPSFERYWRQIQTQEGFPRRRPGRRPAPAMPASGGSGNPERSGEDALRGATLRFRTAVAAADPDPDPAPAPQPTREGHPGIASAAPIETGQGAATSSGLAPGDHSTARDRMAPVGFRFDPEDL